MKRISLLTKQIKDASQKYYEDGTSPLTDAEFDKKLNELKEQDPTNELITKVGHGYEVNKDTTYGTKREHVYGLVGSLDKVHNWKELTDNLKNRRVICSLKLDGISCVLYYKEGNLDYALTRGDGEVGIDITDKVKIISPDLATIKFTNETPFTGAIRGELLMKLKDFEEYSKTHEEAKNPRNVTAGLINRKEYDENELKYISLVLYSFVASNQFLDYGFDSHLNLFYKLEKVHEVAPFIAVSKLYEHDFDNFMDKNGEHFNLYGYPSDGIVIASDELMEDFIDKDEYLYKLNWYSQAYKFPAEFKTTTIEEVEWNLSKTGYLIPKIKFNTIQLSGTDVSYATAFNAEYVRENNLNKGTKVVITKSGEIIPYIVQVVSWDKEAHLPETCPSCGKELEMQGVHLTCTNPECNGTMLWNLIHWIKVISPVDGLSNTLISNYVDILGLKTIKDIYSKPEEEIKEGILNAQAKDDLGKQDELFIQCFEGLINNKVDICTAIKACNIPRFSDKTSLMCNEYYEELLEYAETGKPSSKLKKLGDANYKSLVSNYDKLTNILYIKNNIIKSETPTTSIKGNVCITGKLSVKRKDFEKELLDAGYKSVSSVSKDTLFLITDDPNSGSSKNKKADKYNITKITEQEFRDTYLVAYR